MDWLGKFLEETIAVNTHLFWQKYIRQENRDENSKEESRDQMLWSLWRGHALEKADGLQADKGGESFGQQDEGTVQVQEGYGRQMAGGEELKMFVDDSRGISEVVGI